MKTGAKQSVRAERRENGLASSGRGAALSEQGDRPLRHASSAAIYARFSVGNDKDSSTIENQIAMCRELAARLKIAIDENHIYADKGISGGTTDRPAYQRMLNNIESGNFPQVLIIKDLSRLGRDEIEVGIRTEWIWERNVAIKYVLNPEFGDPREADQRLIQRIVAIVADNERRRKAREVYSHQKANAKAGYWNGGPKAPYGYEVEHVEINGKRKARLKINPAEAPIIRKAFDMHIDGIETVIIADRLNISKYILYRSFRQPFVYAGCIIYDKKSKENATMVPDAHDPIITTEEAELISKSARNRKSGKPPVALLSGILTCKICGGNFVKVGGKSRHNKQKRYTYYACSTRKRKAQYCPNRAYLRKEETDRFILAHIQKRIIESDFLERNLAKIQAQLTAPNDDESGEIQKQIGQTEKRIKRLVDTLAEEDMPIDAIREKLKTEQAQKERLLEELQRLKQPQITQINIEQIRKTLKSALNPTIDEEQTKAALRQLIKTISVYPDKTLEINYLLGTELHSPHHTLFCAEKIALF